METCKTCRHWFPARYERVPHGWGGCKRFDRAEPSKTPPKGVSAIVDWSPLDEGAAFYSAPDFGCVLHEPDTQTVREDDGA